MNSDVLVRAAWRLYDSERLLAEAVRAAAAGDYWHAYGFLNSAAFNFVYVEERGFKAMMEPSVFSRTFGKTQWDCLNKILEEGSAPGLSQYEYDNWELTTRIFWLSVLSPMLQAQKAGAENTDEGFVESFRPGVIDDPARIVHLVETTAAGREYPMDTTQLQEKLALLKFSKEADYNAFDPLQLKQWTQALASALDQGAPQVVQVLGMLHKWEEGLWAIMRLPEFKEFWALWDQVDLQAVLPEPQAIMRTGALHLAAVQCHLAPLALLFAIRGDMDSCNFGVALHRKQMNAMFEFAKTEDGKILKHFLWKYCSDLAAALQILGRAEEAASLLSEAGLTWENADGCADTVAEGGMMGPWNLLMKHRRGILTEEDAAAPLMVSNCEFAAFSVGVLPNPPER